MGRFITNPDAGGESSSNPLTIPYGGTGGSSEDEAADNLRVVKLSSVGKPLGVAELDADGFILAKQIAGGGTVGVTINGPTTLFVNQLGSYTITNYDSATAYTATTTNGMVTVNANIVNYTPTSAGVSGFSVNGRAVVVTVGTSGVVNPVIVSPSTGTSVASGTLLFTGNAFSNNGSPDTHQMSTWQIANSSTFTTVLFSSVDTTSEKTSWSVSGLLANTTYYARVKYKGTTLGYSGYSNVVSFTTNDITITGPTSLNASAVGTFTISNFDSAIVYTVSAQTGSVTRSTNTITYTAPSSGGSGSFTINGKVVTVTVASSGITQPSFTAPTNNASVPSGTVSFTSSAFANTGTPDTHQSSSWQVSRSADFSTLDFAESSVVDSTTDLTTWSSIKLACNIPYFARVKYKSVSGLESAWATVSFRTNDITISGPSNANVGSVATFTISNYDSGMTYNIDSLTGTFNRSGATISFTPTSTSGTASFVINGKLVPMAVTASGMNTPTVSTPTSGSSVASGTVAFTSSPFSNTGTADTHQSSSWHVATDATFTNIVLTNNDSTTDKTTWSATGLLANKTYYVRVRYKGATLGYSNWSVASTVLTNDITVSGPANLNTNQVGTFTITNFDSAVVYNVATTNGTVTRSSNTVTYTAGTVAGAGGFTVNGKAVNVAVSSAGMNTPVISYPSNGSAIGSGTRTIVGGAFSNTGTADTHAQSTWQLSTLADFSVITQQSVDSASNLTSWSVSGLLANTTYYVRVKYKGVVLGYSAYSGTVSFMTNDIALSSASSVYVREPLLLTISNFDNSVLYNISATLGTASLSGNTIIYVAGVTSGLGTVTVNGKVANFTVTAAGVLKPSITSPTSGSGVSSGNRNFTSSAFAVAGPSDVHRQSSWELSTSSSFSPLTSSLYNSANSLLNWSATGLLANTSYYVRVKHFGTSNGESVWSDTVAFNTTDITVSGPSSVYAGQTAIFTISNYDSSMTYTLAGNNGSVTQSSNLVTYVAGAAGVGGFVINGKSVTLMVLAASVTTPSIITPTNGTLNVNMSLTFTANAFSTTGVADTHQMSTWQIATDNGFTNIVQQSADDGINKITWTATNLSANTTYYARVRYKGATLPYSAYSASVIFSTKSSFYATLETKVMVASDAVANDTFGDSVAMSSNGSVVLIGATGKDVGGLSDRGQHYVFRRSGNTWTQEAILVQGGAAADRVGTGSAVSSDGSFVVITDTFLTKVIRKEGGSWLYKSSIAPSGVSAGYRANRVVMSPDNTTVAVFRSSASGGYPFYVDVYSVVGNATSTQIYLTFQATLSPSDAANAPQANFGYEMAFNTNGTRLVIGSPGISSVYGGGLYTFVRSGSTWSQQSKIIEAESSDNNGKYYFGRGVSMTSDGSVLVVGNPYKDAGLGAVFVYNWSGSAWSKVATLTGSTPPEGIGSVGLLLGHSVCVSEDGATIYAGAPGTNESAGRVYIFGRTGGVWSEQTSFKSSVTESGSYFGAWLAMAADVKTIAVTAHGRNSRAGQVLMFT